MKGKKTKERKIDKKGRGNMTRLRRGRRAGQGGLRTRTQGQ